MARLSYTSGYTDDTLFIDLLPGESLTERRAWVPRDGYDTLIPAGVYEAYGRFEPWLAPEPLFGRTDPTLTQRMFITLVE